MRERALKIVLVLVGLFFVAAIYPLRGVWHAVPADWGDDMMLSLYFVLGIFLLMAVRDPAAHRSLIGFAAWSSFAHAIVMGIIAFHNPGERTGMLIGDAVLVAIGITLIALAPAKREELKASAARA